MQKHQLYINLLALSSALALAACADKGGVEDVVTPPAPEPEIVAKTPIELSIGGVDGELYTRAVITDGTNKAMEPFAENTKIFMIMQSEYDNTDHGEYNYGGVNAPDDLKVTKYTVSRGDVKKYVENSATGEDGITVSFSGSNQKYWDDAHARSSQLSIWAYAQMSQTWTTCSFPQITNGNLSIDDVSQGTFQTNQDIDWLTTQIYPAILSWSVGNPGPNQSATTLIGQDLLFSNNLADHNPTTGTRDEAKDKRLKYDFAQKQFPGKNDVKTEMKFYHAMSKITIQLKAGSGFKGDDTDFQLKKTSDVKTIDLLHGFNTNGLFNIKDGEFQKINKFEDITSIPLISEIKNDKTKPYYTLQALIIPNIHEFLQSQATPAVDLNSRFVEGSTDVMMEFTIDNNKYKITSGMLYGALSSLTVGSSVNQIKKGTYDSKSYIPLEAGKNYIFTFTIGKSEISNITAKLAKWTDVTANELTPSNTYVNLSLKTNEGATVNTVDPQVDLYRAKDLTSGPIPDYDTWAVYKWESGYTASNSKATLSQITTNGTVYTAKDESDNQWVWPDNNTYYHFRTINKGLTITAATGSAPNDYVSIYSGPINNTYPATGISTSAGDGKYNDYLWGAPFKQNGDNKVAYSSSYGFCNNATASDGQIYKAIGATNDNITLIQHHMMSNIYVDLANTGSDPVTISGATVKIVRYAKEAKIQMGNGLVTGLSNYDNGTGSTMTVDHKDAVTGPPAIPEYDYSYRVVPQPLSYTDGSDSKTIGIEITTTDGNVYKIPDLSRHKINGTEDMIGEWLPGKNYYYKFVLKKTGIEHITATVVDWENIVATPDDEVVIE